MGRAGWALGVALVVACGCDRRWVWSAGGEWSLGPAEVDFGAVQVGGTAHRSLQLTNDGRTPLTVLSVGGAEGPFALSGVAPGDVLPPASSRPVTLTFAPGAEVAEEAELLVEVDSPGTRAVRARGVGGQARLEASPLFVDFGSVELPGRASQQVVLRNAGNVAAEPLLALGGDAPDAFSVTSAPGVLLPGEERPVGLLFHPLQLGLARAGLEVRACAACPPLEVGLQGMGSAGIVSVAPQRLDFGRVPVGNTAVLKLSVSHNGTTPLTFLPPVIQGTAAAPFTVLSAPALPGDQLLPGMVVEVVVQFAPAAAGKVAGAWLRLPLKASNTDGRVDVPLSGEGGGGCVLVLPRELDFGTVPQGMTVTQRVDVLNRCAAEVALTDLQVLGATGGYFSLVQGASSATVPVGGVRSLRVAFTPRQGETAASATLALKAWEGSAPYGLAVPLRAQSRVFAPCAASLTPQALDFGGVQVGTSTSLGVAVTNTGADDCVVSGLSLVAGSDSAFQVTPADAVTLRPGESRQLQVAFAPASPQDQSGLAELFVNDPAGGLRQVPLSGTGVLGCLTLAPPLLDFGARMLSCGGRSLALTARNTCSGTALLQQALLAPGGSPEFALGAGPALPLVLQAGQAVTFPVSYQPTNAGADGAAFQLHTGSGPPLTAGVRGEAVLETEASELFVQEARARVDVLLVVDNSGSMLEEQSNLGANFSALLSAAQALGVDYQIGVTTTGVVPSPGSWATCPGGAEGGEKGRLFPVDGTRPRILTPLTPNAAAVFRENTAVGVCHWDEQGLEAAYLALSSPLADSADDPTTPLAADGNGGFVRDGARLALVFVSDEEDASPRPLAFYESFFKGLKGGDPTLLSVSAIVGTSPLAGCPTASSVGARYAALAQATGGSVQPICTQDWAGALSMLSTTAFAPRRIFPLSGTPGSGMGILVEVSGVQQASGWHYDATLRAIVFDPGSEPPPGALVRVTYPLGC